MSDLQCPARVIVLGTSEAADPATAGRLRHERVVHVYAVTPTALPGAEALAVALGVAATRRDELAASTAGPVAGRGPVVDDEVADLHRGETVAVVADDSGPLAAWEGDADGWHLVRLA